MYTTIKAYCIDRVLQVSSIPPITSGGENDICIEVTFDATWDGYARTATFHRKKNKVYHVVMTNDTCVIPREVMAEPGTVFFGIVGTTTNSTRTSDEVALSVAQGAVTGLNPFEPLPDVYKQVLAAEQKNEARLENLLKGGTTDGEVVDIRVGADGKTYSTAGEAVRNQLTHHSALLNAYYTNVVVEMGQLNAVSNTQRLHAVLPVGVDTVKVSSTASYKHALQGYTDAKHTSKSYDSGWVLGGAEHFELDPLLYYNVEFLRVDESKMTEADIASVAVFHTAELTKTVEHLLETTAASEKGLAEQTSLYNTYYNEAEVLVSGIQGAGNPYRLHALLKPGVSHFKVVSPAEYTYGIQGYSSSDYSVRVYDSGWLRGNTRHTEMDASLYYNIEFRKADDSVMPEPAKSGILVLQSLSLTDIVDGLVGESARRIAPYYDATQDFVRSIAHRGCSSEAPENTAPAFVLAKQKGFQYVETDIQVTSDGKYVCVHDGTCSKYTNEALPNAVSAYTLSELQAQDWGAWMDEKWAGTKILTFEECVKLCKRLSLNMYIELKYTHSDDDVKYYVEYLRSVGMLGKVSWLPGAYIDNVRAYDPTARVAITGSAAPTEEWIARCKADYQTEEGEFFFDLDVSCVTEELSQKLTAAGIPLEVWTVNDMTTVERLLQMNVSGITTDSLLVGRELLSGYMSAVE